MPLITNDIGQARVAYDALELRATSAEQRAQQLDTTVTNLQNEIALQVQGRAVLRQRVLDLEADKILLQTRLDTLQRARTDAQLEQFISAIGLAAAVGEAAMPDRAISSVSATLQSFFTPSDGVGIRFVPPELATPLGGTGAGVAPVSSATFEIVKVPPPIHGRTPTSLFTVLQGVQQAFSAPFWSSFSAAANVVAEATKTIAGAGSWNFPGLVQRAGAIAAVEKTLAQQLAAATPPVPAASFGAVIDRLQALIDSLSPAVTPNPTVGPVVALTTALEATLEAAKTIA